MSYIDIWTRSAETQTDIPANRFVDQNGNLGGNSGVVITFTPKNTMASIITIGEAEVEIAPSTTLSIGDLVTNDEQGFAIKSSDSNGYPIINLSHKYARVLLK